MNLKEFDQINYWDIILTKSETTDLRLTIERAEQMERELRRIAKWVEKRDAWPHNDIVVAIYDIVTKTFPR